MRTFISARLAMLCLVATCFAALAPGTARAQLSGLCDQVTVEYFSKFWHIKPPIARPLNEEMNARQIACNNVYPLTPSLDLVVGYGGIVFLNSFNAQSFSLGVDFEAQYRPAFLGNLGAYVGLDAGFIYGYQGFLRQSLLIGAWRAGAIAKAGILWDVPDTNLTAFAGVRYVPARGRAGSGILAPGVGLTYHLDAPRHERARFSTKGAPRFTGNPGRAVTNTRF